MTAQAGQPRIGRADLRQRLRAGLSLPVIAAPMFLVSGPDMVIAACRAGIIGAFPTLNARTPGDLDSWLARIKADTKGAAPFAANLILDKRNPRREADLAAILRHQPPLVIASVGAPDPILAPVHGYGGLVFSDVATLRHARKAAQAGADGLVLLTAGAGGNTGWLNPFAFVAAVRAFFDGPIALAGGLTRAADLHALAALDVDFAYMGTPFLAAAESMAPVAHKQAVVDADIDDIILSDRISGLNANMLRPRLIEAGVIDADGTVRDMRGDTLVSWNNVWSAGHGVGSVATRQPVAKIVAGLRRDFTARGAS
ncbi:MAG: nitronate monooxygenase [Pseudomonadota bacterium]|nr:nitronate monooxygenase [Pseudomonadota bacterium]